MNADDRFLVVGCATLGFVLGTAICGAVLRWLYGIGILMRAGREAKQDAAQQRGAFALAAMIFLHAGPWMFAIAVLIAYRVLSAPHAHGWDVTFVAMAASPVVYVILAVVAILNKSRLYTESEVLAMSPDEKARWVMQRSLWVCLPVWSVFVWLGWEWVVRAPELAVLFGALAYLASYLMGRLMVFIRFPAPWKRPSAPKS